MRFELPSRRQLNFTTLLIPARLPTVARVHSCRAELQCIVQTAFDEMEAVLALGRTPPMRPRATRVLSGNERRELNLPSALDDRERSVHGQRQEPFPPARSMAS